ncbi:MAG: sigma-54 dependent transcriptional regulator [Candidatus Sumerlaeia bacterium]|nr:sigma-54 dependent transcriptional regulator [Candidatus Sumerlaeia bacterium]
MPTTLSDPSATALPGGGVTDHRVLVCDDEKNMRRLLTDLLSDDGWDVEAVGTAEDALAALQAGRYSILVLDLALPGMNGMELLGKINELGIDVAVVIITAFASVDIAVRAMKGGAVDFLVKPFDNQRLRASLRRIRETRDMTSQVGLSHPSVGTPPADPGHGEAASPDIIGTDKRMADLHRIVRQVASTRACVLITGESGTGKELVARAIHYNGDRREAPFVAVNCAALPETLLESEFFGHERGSFTGAYALQRGRFEQAHGGTLFLDEVGDMPPSLQVKLLRVLQDGRFTRVGGDKDIEVDVRVIAATHQDLGEMVRDRSFREDLFYRLNVIPIQLPPLRERTGDIGQLVSYFAAKFSRRHRMPKVAIPDEVLEAMAKYAWPGNIRELQNCVEKAVVLQDLTALVPSNAETPAHVVRAMVGAAGSFITAHEVVLSLAEPENEVRALHDVSDDAQRAAVLRALRLCGGNKAEAAKRLNISYKTLFNKIHDLGLPMGHGEA